MRTVTDQMGRTVLVPQHPVRIVSLVPSQTELLYDLGLDAEVVGQTLFCIHPAQQHQTKPRVGGTKKLNLDKIRALNPDLIIGNKEENERSQIEQLEKEFPVWMSDITSLDDALVMIEQVGALVHQYTRANELVHSLRTQFAAIQTTSQTFHVLYLIWREPWMGAAHDTFIGNMLYAAGWHNVLQAPAYHRYPQLTPAEVAALDADVIFLSSEPYPFKEQHIRELKLISPGSHILLVDGELFSWYGSRLQHSAGYLNELQKNLSV